MAAELSVRMRRLLAPSFLHRRLSAAIQYWVGFTRFPEKTSFSQLISSSPPSWMVRQISNDLSSFSLKTSPENTRRVFFEDPQQSLFYYLIYVSINGKEVRCLPPEGFHRSAPLFIKARLKRVERALQWLARFGILKVDFLLSLHDAVGRHPFEIPVFSFSKDRNLDEKVILMPDDEALGGHSHLLDQVKRGTCAYPWDEKKEKGFWRGGTTGEQVEFERFLALDRTKPILLSIEYPEFIDARFTGLHQADPLSRKKILEEFPHFFGQFVNIKNHFQYKYQILIDGNTCAYSRFFWQLFSNCVVLKQISPNIQWYYEDLKPYEHFIPIDPSLTNLLETIKWCKQNDEAMKKVVCSANEFAKTHLALPQVLQYLYLLLKEYGRV